MENVFEDIFIYTKQYEVETLSPCFVFFSLTDVGNMYIHFDNLTSLRW